MKTSRILRVAAIAAGTLCWALRSQAGPPPNADAVTLVKGNGASIYMVVGGKKQLVSTQEVFNGCGLKLEGVVTTSDDILIDLPDGPPLTTAPLCKAAKALPAFPSGTLLQGANGKVYMIVRGVKRWVKSTEVFESCGLSSSAVAQYPDGIAASIPDGPDITTVAACTTAKAIHEGPPPPAPRKH